MNAEQVYTYSAAACNKDITYTNRRASPVGIGTPLPQEAVALSTGEALLLTHCCLHQDFKSVQLHLSGLWIFHTSE